MISHIKASIVVDGISMELGRTFYTGKQALDYCENLVKSGHCESYIVSKETNEDENLLPCL